MIAEFNGVKALLEAVPLLAGKVVDTAIVDDGKLVRSNYLVLSGSGPEELSDGRWGSVPRPESDALYEFPAKAVGTDPEAVRLIGDAVQSVVGKKPTVAGRRCDPVTVDFDAVKRDNSVSPPLFFMDMWVITTSRRA